MGWRHRTHQAAGRGDRETSAAVRLNRADRVALREWTEERAQRAAARPFGQAASVDQHHGTVNRRTSRKDSGSLQRIQRENRELRSQLESQWSAMYEAMLQSTEHAAEMRAVRDANRCLRQQNQRLLSNERQAFRCIADNERKTDSYRKRNRALVRRNKDLLSKSKQLRAQLADVQRRMSDSGDTIESDDADSL